MEDKSKYANFFKRFFAYAIDLILVGFVQSLVIMPLLGLLGFGIAIGEDFSEPEKLTFIGILAGFGVAAYIGIFIIGWLYFALLESSSRQATLGKMAMDIMVTDIYGERLSFVKATLRYFGKYLSGLFFCLGYIIAAFTDKRQALHDFIANSLVVNK